MSAAEVNTSTPQEIIGLVEISVPNPVVDNIPQMRIWADAMPTESTINCTQKSLKRKQLDEVGSRFLAINNIVLSAQLVIKDGNNRYLLVLKVEPIRNIWSDATKNVVVSHLLSVRNQVVNGSFGEQTALINHVQTMQKPEPREYSEIVSPNSFPLGYNNKSVKATMLLVNISESTPSADEISPITSSPNPTQMSQLVVNEVQNNNADPEIIPANQVSGTTTLQPENQKVTTGFFRRIAKRIRGTERSNLTTSQELTLQSTTPEIKKKENIFKILFRSGLYILSGATVLSKLYVNNVIDYSRPLSYTNTLLVSQYNDILHKLPGLRLNVMTDQESIAIYAGAIGLMITTWIILGKKRSKR